MIHTLQFSTASNFRPLQFSPLFKLANISTQNSQIRILFIVYALRSSDSTRSVQSILFVVDRHVVLLFEGLSRSSSLKNELLSYICGYGLSFIFWLPKNNNDIGTVYNKYNKIHIDWWGKKTRF